MRAANRVVGLTLLLLPIGATAADNSAKDLVGETLYQEGSSRDGWVPDHYKETVYAQLPGGVELRMVSSAEDGRIYYVLFNKASPAVCVRFQWTFAPESQALRYTLKQAEIVGTGQMKLVGVLDHATGPKSLLSFTGKIWAWPARTDVESARCSSALPQGITWPVDYLEKDYFQGE